MSKEAIDELKRLRSILSGITGLEDDDQEYIEDARKSVDRIIEALAEQPAQQLPFGVGGGLVAIKTLLSRDPCVHANTAIEMIDAILAEPPTQPQQEPVAWFCKEHGEVDTIWSRQQPTWEGQWKPLYTSPQAQRTWVGLSAEDREQHRNDWYSNIHDKEFQAIEAKLKEKNA